jgi:hypothetical protein
MTALKSCTKRGPGNKLKLWTLSHMCDVSLPSSTTRRQLPTPNPCQTLRYQIKILFRFKFWVRHIFCCVRYYFSQLGFILFLFCDRRFNAHTRNAYAAVMPSSHLSFVILMDDFFLAQKSGFRSCFL